MSSSSPPSQSSNNHWCTIESDPGVFTSLIESFGVQNAELAELWSLDDDSLSALGSQVYGLIFLFKWQSAEKPSDKCLKRDEIPSDLFFAKQVTTNACATQAILSVLLNAEETEEKEEGKTTTTTAKQENQLRLGPILSSLRSFTTSFPPDLRGEAIAASDEIRTAHNSFARNESFLAEQKHRKAEEDDDVFHFIAYIPHHKDNSVYELDGLQEGPIRVGQFTKQQKNNDWIGVARTAIQERIEKYAASEIKFNLMAVVRDRRAELKDQLIELKNAGIGEEEEEVLTIRAQLGSEEEKRNQWKLENERRRHNYLPFCLELLKAVVRKGKLEEAMKKANERVAEQRKKANENSKGAKK